ncbi:hypothetical protein [Blastococcus sp. TF02-09]|uniref:hypothetical protein n=1 Tax=Blastococcus sp. TF02-09 TaxID=2250576 RepID=UPI0011BD817B|nr:hypothetical protein [Blastococcus sp. TF02-9]
MVDYKQLRPAQILLDPQNPRLPDGTSNDREAINRLLGEGYSQLLALARDLMERGEVNPTELPIVMKDGTKFVVLEGNRRFAALKLIDDPRLADDPAHRNAFERLKRTGGAPPSSVYCAVAADRDEADHWITLRHTGANDGVGVRVWSAEQNARHRQRMRAPIDSGTARSIAIADELTEAYQADLDLVDRIKRVRVEKLTNIGRLFSGVMLARMQFTMRQVNENGPQTLWARHTASELHGYFRWAFQVLEERSVDAFKNDSVRSDLLNEAGAVLPAAAQSLPEAQRLADYPYSPPRRGSDPTRESDAAHGGSSSNSSAPATPPVSNDKGKNEPESSGETDTLGGGRQRDQRPERTLYSNVRLPNLSANLQRLLREARQLPIEENYAAACVLARVILELAVSEPKVLAWSGKKESDSLRDKIRGCLESLDPQIDRPKRTRQDLVQAHLETSGIGVVYMHQFMHNPSAKADPHLARRFSAAFTPLLNSINESVQ